ncbi:MULTISPECIES: acyl-CoA dehydrogenase family protein [unclassified Wenzhouxiangella]|uniref:acyl-CoA dehydrogenase family protein n=1 Tax=unclassified Wenzhouxiangella TaxID=2613841 RepID=UPI000E326E80|nr:MULTISPECIES: acyl-CoA dehydrogenase family protein [unclassified Wenzhouxiangella]RFF28328.1 acyl-CoA dehydrogenase [Wenzhouxiangella sp. 15181]RFP67746.1 acyl-CoA dehydrogenase [Wenzhouxiangella sp. 15190]
MDFALTDEQQMIQAAARDFARDEIAPIAPEFDASGEFPLETIQRMGELGLMGIEVPEEYGGSGLDTIGYALAMMEVSAADAAHGTIMSVNNSLFCNGILKHGTEEQKQRYVRAIASGEEIGAYALTEPQSGSDAANMKSRAVLSDDGSHYVINARKSWITSGPVARYLVLFAMTDPDAGAKGVTAFIIDAEKEGFHRGKLEPKLGIRASATCEIELTDYKCPVEDRLGEEGQGFKIAMGVLDAGRIGIAAQAVGIAQAAFDASVEYAQERKAFGREIGTFQMIQAKLADMKTRLEAARLLTLKAAWTKMKAMETGGRFTQEGSMAKLFASEAAMWIAHQAVQIHGGMGYSKEMPVERYFRDAKITEIYEGTSEIQRMLIARMETGLR